MKTPILETERLILRPLTVAYAKEAYENWTSDPEVAKYMIWSTHSNVEITKQWLTDAEKSIDSDSAYDWGFFRKEDGKLIGSGGIYYVKKHVAFEIGYNIMKACWHQGYTTEAANAMLTFAIQALEAKRFYGRHAKENIYSGKVMEKLGMKFVREDEYNSADGTKHFVDREYILELPFRNCVADVYSVYYTSI